MKEQVQKAEGKLGILNPCPGAVANTLMAGVEAVNKQLIKWQNTLRHIMGEQLITHPGLDYYQEEAGVLNDAAA